MADSEQDSGGRVVQISGTSFGKSKDHQGSKPSNDNEDREVEDG